MICQSCGINGSAGYLCDSCINDEGREAEREEKQWKKEQKEITPSISGAINKQLEFQHDLSKSLARVRLALEAGKTAERAVWASIRGNSKASTVLDEMKKEIQDGFAALDAIEQELRSTIKT